MKKRVAVPERKIEISVTYLGVSPEKDAAIGKALGKYGDGSGFMIAKSVRDHHARVPEKDFDRVLAMLKQIPGITIRRLVTSWETC